MSKSAPSAILARIRDAAVMLAVSERQVWVLIRRGDLTPIWPPGVRAVRLRVAEIEALVARWGGR